MCILACSGALMVVCLSFGLAEYVLPWLVKKPLKA